MYDDNDYATISFNFTENVNDTFTHIHKKIERLDVTYHEVVNEFVSFLNAMGYDYIGGLVVLDTDGAPIFTTETL